MNNNNFSLKASILVIGNEILSGRIQDKNINYIASRLSDLGILLGEVRIVPDIEDEIIFAVRELSNKYKYVFSTGGIGPTHDDITCLSMCRAFGYEYELNNEMLAFMEEKYNLVGRKFTEASKKMAYIPKGAKLIDNNLSFAPGFIIENVFVMAGIPQIMKDMFDNIVHLIETSEKFHSYSIHILVGESRIAQELEYMQNMYPDVDMGSYPKISFDKHSTDIVFRSKNIEELEQSFNEFLKIIKDKEFEIFEIIKK